MVDFRRVLGWAGSPVILSQGCGAEFTRRVFGLAFEMMIFEKGFHRDERPGARPGKRMRWEDWLFPRRGAGRIASANRGRRATICAFCPAPARSVSCISFDEVLTKNCHENTRPSALASVAKRELWKDTAGLMRESIRTKCEEVVMPKCIDESKRWHKRTALVIRRRLKRLNLPYRVTTLHGGDIGLRPLDDGRRNRMRAGQTPRIPRAATAKSIQASRLYEFQARRL